MHAKRIRHSLYLLAAMLLLLQSFSIWHDVEHPFHQAELQCERLDAIHHAPALDHTPTLTTRPTQTLASRVTVSAVGLTSDLSPTTIPIRGPPRHT